MKRVLLLVVGCWLMVGVRGQSDFRFADSTAQWNVLESGWSVDFGAWEQMKFLALSNDTIIAGVNYQQILLQGGLSETFYLRKDSSDKVWYSRAAWIKEYPLYDFQKLPGDTFYSTVYERFYSDSSFVIVDSVDSVFIGKWRKRMFVHGYSIHDNFPNPEDDILIDGIGSLRKYLFSPVYDYHSTDNSTYFLLCYHEQGQLLYVNPAYNICMVGIRDLISAGSISPNPATTSLSIQLSQTPSHSTVFQLYDITGRMILEKPLSETSSQLDLNGVSKGIYLYNVVSGKEKAGAGKLVVE